MDRHTAIVIVVRRQINYPKLQEILDFVFRSTEGDWVGTGESRPEPWLSRVCTRYGTIMVASMNGSLLKEEIMARLEGRECSQ